MLNIMTLAYSGQMSALVSIGGTMPERRERLFEVYVNKALRRGTANEGYTPERTNDWLSWLAYQMSKHGQTVFYLEGLQSDWLGRKRRESTALRLANNLPRSIVPGRALMSRLAPELFPDDIRCFDRIRFSWSRFRRHLSLEFDHCPVLGWFLYQCNCLLSGVFCGAVAWGTSGWRAGIAVCLTRSLCVGLLGTEERDSHRT
jgi:hypothetical protein